MRLIDAERFECIGFKATGEQRYDDGFADGAMFILEKIDSAPTIDAIPVVRCKDCICFVPYNTEKDSRLGKCTDVYLPMNGETVDGWWFCADGEKRRDDETHE